MCENPTNQDLTFLQSDRLAGMNDLPPDGLAIPDEKRGRPVPPERLSAGFACASLACSLSLWLGMGLFYLQDALHFSLPGWKWVDNLPGWA